MKQVTVRAFRGMSNINMMKAFMLLEDLSTKQEDKLKDEHVKYKERIAFCSIALYFIYGIIINVVKKTSTK